MHIPPPPARLILALLLAAVASPVAAQTGSNSIAGMVQDAASSSGVPGASVTVINETTGRTRNTTANAEGIYEVVFLAAGRYTVLAEQSGFASASCTGIALDGTRVARIDLRLTPLPATAAVEPFSQRLGPSTDAPEHGWHLAAGEIAALPLIGRDFASLQILFPGVQPAANTGNLAGRRLSEGFRIAGGTNYSSGFPVEQAANNRSYYHGNASSPPLEIIQEVRIQSAGLLAEYGGDAHQVVVSMKGGSRQYHGSAFDYLQHDRMNMENAMSGAEPPFLRRSQFGASLAGPMWKDRLFFFGVYEGLRQHSRKTLTTQVATEDQRAGLFPTTGGDAVTLKDPLTGKPFPGNRIPLSRFSPLANYFLEQVWPLPNLGAQLYREDTAPVVIADQFNVKADYIPSRDQSLALQVSRLKKAFDKEVSQLLLAPETDRFDDLVGSLRYTRSVGQHLVNSLLIAAQRNYNAARSSADQETSSSFADRIGMNLGGPTGTGYPLISIAGRGFAGRTGQLNTPVEHSGNTCQLQDTLGWTAGRHSLSLGFEVRRYQTQELQDDASVGQFNFNGRYSGSSLADFFLGLPNQAAYAPALGRIYQRNTLWSAFAQDYWRIRRDLTLSLGVRYDTLSWPTERYNRMATSHPQLGMGVIVSSDGNQLPAAMDPVAVSAYPAGSFITSRQAGIPRSLRFPDRNNIAPHIGLAYRAAQGMVVRASYGIDFLKESQAVFNDREGSFGLPFRFNRVMVNPNPAAFDILKPFADYTPRTRSSIDSAWYVDPHFELAAMQTWSLSIESGLPWHSVLNVGYVGNRLTHGKQTWDWNQSPAWPNRDDRFPGYAKILALTSGGDSRYHSLQARWRRQVTQGLLGLVNYTWSKTLTNLLDEGEAPSIWVHSPDMQWGRSRWDRRHVISGSFVYQLPWGKGGRWLHSLPAILDGIIGGWQLSGIVTFMTGKPLTITSTLAKANLAVAGSVPADRLADGRLENPNSGRWFDQTAFAPPPANRPGNAGYGLFDGPGYVSEDLALCKTMRIREAARLQFRLEAYNAFNHVNLGDPVTDVDNWSMLGKILTSGEALRFQAVLRIDF